MTVVSNSSLMLKAWNSNQAVGQRKPFTLQEIQAIANHLESHCRLRDLALFMVGINTMLRCSNILALTVKQVTDNRGAVVDRFSVVQIKTRKIVTVQMDTATQLVLRRWITTSNKGLDDYLFTGLTVNSKNQAISASHYRSLVKGWAAAIGLNPEYYSTHSLRRSRAALLYSELLDVELIRVLLGQSSIAATSAYLGVSVNYALGVVEERPLFQELLPQLRSPHDV